MENDVKHESQDEVIYVMDTTDESVCEDSAVCPSIESEEVVFIKCEPELDELRVKKSKYKTNKWNVRTRLTKDEYLRKQRELYHQKRAKLTEEQKKIKRIKRNNYLAQKSLLETDEQREDRLLKRRLKKHHVYNEYYYQLLKSRMTKEGQKTNGEYHNKWKQLKFELPEELRRMNRNHLNKYWLKKRKTDLERRRDMYTSMTKEERDAILERRRKKYTSWTKEQRERKKEYERLRSAKIRNGEWKVQKKSNHLKKKYIFHNQYPIITKCVFKLEPYIITHVNNLHVIDGKEPVLKLKKISNDDIENALNINKNITTDNLIAMYDHTDTIVDRIVIEHNYTANLIELNEVSNIQTSNQYSIKESIVNNNNLGNIDNNTKINCTKLLPRTEDKSEIAISCDSTPCSLCSVDRTDDLKGKNSPFTENVQQHLIDHCYAISNEKNPENFMKRLNLNSNIDSKGNNKWASTSKSFTFGKTLARYNKSDLNRVDEIITDKNEKRSNEIMPYKGDRSAVKHRKDFVHTIDNALYNIIKKMYNGKTIHEAITDSSTDDLRDLLKLLGTTYSTTVSDLKIYNYRLIKFEIDLNCLIKLLINWIERNDIKKIDSDNIVDIYNNMYRYLINFNSLTGIKTFCLSKNINRNCEDTEIVMYIRGPFSQFWNMFCDPIQKRNMSASLDFENIFHMPFISTRISLPHFSMVHANTAVSEFYLINKNNSFTSTYDNKSTNLLVKKNSVPKQEFLTGFIEQFLNQLIYAIDEMDDAEITSQSKMHLISVIEEFERLLATFPNTISTDISYYRNLSPYPYVRCLKRNVNNESLDCIDPMIRQANKTAALQEVLHPMTTFFMGEFEMYYEYVGNDVRFIFNNLFLRFLNNCIHYKCILCDENLGAGYPLNSIKAHLVQVHGFGSDWKCVKCSKSYSTKYLSMNGWKHDCYTCT